LSPPNPYNVAICPSNPYNVEPQIGPRGSRAGVRAGSRAGVCVGGCLGARRFVPFGVDRLARNSASVMAGYARAQA
jgi:hypothetical protein